MTDRVIPGTPIILRPSGFGDRFTPWTVTWYAPRQCKLLLRKNAQYPLREGLEVWNRRVILVHCPRMMDPVEEGGHSLYQGEWCWDIDQTRLPEELKSLPFLGYVSEQDMEWIEYDYD